MNTPIIPKDVNIGDTVTFSMYTVNSSGVNGITNGKVLGIVSGAALRFPDQAAATHPIMYPLIPQVPTGVPNNYRLYDYLLLSLVSEEIIEVGIPWINPITSVKVSGRVLSITINNFKDANTEAIQSLLIANGYEQIKITLS